MKCLKCLKPIKKVVDIKLNKYLKHLENWDVCDDCNMLIQNTQAEKEYLCPRCRKPMRWDLKGIGIPSGDYYHESDTFDLINVKSIYLTGCLDLAAPSV